MAIWSDPLDELIGDLERTIPTASTPFQNHVDYGEMLVGFQLLVAAIMSRSEERIARAKQAPARRRG